MTLRFERVSTRSREFVEAVKRHYTGSEGAPPGKRIAWRVCESDATVGWLGIGEPAGAD